MKFWDKLQSDWKQSRDEWGKLSSKNKFLLLLQLGLTVGIGLFIISYFAFMYVPLVKNFLSSLKVMVDDPIITYDLKVFLAYEFIFAFATALLLMFFGMFIFLMLITEESERKVELKKLKKEIEELKQHVVVDDK